MKKKILHLMRTYGAHGGEQQLSQYFGAEPVGNVEEVFGFVYRDDVCAGLFLKRAPRLRYFSLIDAFCAVGTAWREFARLLPRLLYCQLLFFRSFESEKPVICVVHGFQAALIAWPTVVFSRRSKWIYMHRVTKAKNSAAVVFRFLYWPFDIIAGNSQAVTQSLSSLAPRGKLTTLDNGIDIANFDRRAKLKILDENFSKIAAVKIVSVGRLLPQKGQAMLIDAFALLAAKNHDISLLIVGDGPMKEFLRSKIIASGFQDRISLLGYRDDVPAILSGANIFANASLWEGMSNAVLEGMAAGLPSVVIDAPGVTECHKAGVTGFVVGPTVDELASAIQKLLDQPDVAKNMGLAARLHVSERYSMESNRRRFLDLFDRLAVN